MFLDSGSKRKRRRSAVSGVLGGLLLFITILAGTGVLLGAGALPNSQLNSGHQAQGEVSAKLSENLIVSVLSSDQLTVRSNWAHPSYITAIVDNATGREESVSAYVPGNGVVTVSTGSVPAADAYIITSKGNTFAPLSETQNQPAGNGNGLSYQVQFANDPLPSSAQWCISFNGQNQCALASSPITFTVSQTGTYSWSTQAIISGSTGVRYVANPDQGSVAVTSTVQAASVTIAYTTQYQLTIDSAVGSSTGSGWYDAGSSANFGVSPSTLTSGSTQYRFYEFTSSSSGDPTTTPEGTVTMNAPVTETASWSVWQNEQYSSTTPGYYTYSDYYTYSCPSGENLVGTECQTTNTWYTCPSGYTLQGSTCVEVVTTPGYWTYEWVSNTVWNPGYYSCPYGWQLSGSSCSMTTPGYWTQVTTSYTTTSWVSTGSYQQWVSTGGYWTYRTVQNYFCFWSWNSMPQDPQQVCIPWGTTTIATWVETGYWETVYTGYWLTTVHYLTTYVWNPGSTITAGATWNPGYWSTTYNYEPVWIAPVTTTYTASPTVNTSVTYSAATATLNTTETWHQPVTNYYQAWTDTGTIV